MHFFDIFLVCVRATSTVFLLMAAGALAVSQLTESGKRSLKGLSTTQVFVLLPALIVSRMATGFSWDLLYQGRFAMVMSFTQIFTGVMSSKIAAMLQISPPGYEALVYLVTSSQNAIVYPFTLFQGVRGVQWLNGADAEFFQEGKNIAQMYFLVYNVVFSLSLWSFGHTYVKAESKRRDREAAALEQIQVDAKTSVAKSEKEKSETSNDAEGDVSLVASIKNFFNTTIRPVISPPIIASMTGIPMGLIPFTRWMAQEGPVMSQIMQALWVLGDAAIPLSLVILGCSLRQSLANAQKNNPKKADSGGTNKKSTAADDQQHKQRRDEEPIKSILAKDGKQKKKTNKHAVIRTAADEMVLMTMKGTPASETVMVIILSLFPTLTRVILWKPRRLKQVHQYQQEKRTHGNRSKRRPAQLLRLLRRSLRSQWTFL